MLLSELVDHTLTTQAIVFIGLPKMAAILGEGAFEALVGFRFGRFTVGIAAEQAHEHLFGKEKDTNENSQRISDHPGLWFMREPLDCKLLAAAFDQRISAMTRDLYLTLIGSVLGHLKDDFLADQGQKGSGSIVYSRQ